MGIKLGLQGAHVLGMCFHQKVTWDLIREPNEPAWSTTLVTLVTTAKII